MKHYIIGTIGYGGGGLANCTLYLNSDGRRFVGGRRGGDAHKEVRFESLQIFAIN